ncbi:MAG: hypothetical protein ACPL06_00775 [Candidatus Anstonellales archaeon]
MVEFWEGWEGVCLLISLISVIGTAILIMAAKLFSLKELEQGAKAELTFAISTVLITLFLVLAVNFADSLAMSFAKESSKIIFGREMHANNFWEVSKLYMINIYECYLVSEKILVSMDAPISTIATLKFSALYYDPVGAYTFGMMHEFIANILGLFYYFKWGYKLMIKTVDFFFYIGFPILLPTGVALRAFPPTRGTGAYLIAFSIGIYFIFPVSYLLAIGVMQSPFFCPTFILKFIPLVLDPCEAEDVNIFGLAFSWVMGSLEFISVFFKEFLPGLLRELCINLCIFPFVALMITFSFVNSGSSLFGANIPEVGRGLVRLI